MDGAMAGLREELNRLLKDVAPVLVGLDRANGRIKGVPHFSVIKARAQQLGQELTREAECSE